MKIKVESNRIDTRIHDNHCPAGQCCDATFVHTGGSHTGDVKKGLLIIEAESAI